MSEFTFEGADSPDPFHIPPDQDLDLTIHRGGTYDTSETVPDDCVPIVASDNRRPYSPSQGASNETASSAPDSERLDAAGASSPDETAESQPEGDVGKPPEIPPTDDAPAGGEQDGKDTFLGFRQKFDGTQTPPPFAEQKAAGALLSDFATEACIPWSFAETKEITQGGRRIRVDVSSQVAVQTEREADAELGRTEIAFAEIDSDGKDGESSKYKLYRTGIVTRRDTTRAEREAVVMGMRALPPISDLEDASPKRRSEIAAAHLEWVGKRIGDLTMDMDFGFGEQPVGMEEVQAAIELARRALVRRY